MPASHPLSTLELAVRLESAEGRSNAEAVTSRARMDPSSAACWRDVDGTLAMFDGVGSPLTQTFRLGLIGPPRDAQLEVIESFFAERGATVFHEVSPLAHPDTVAVLNGRGYHPLEFTSVMCQPVAARATTPVSRVPVAVRPIEGGEQELWTRTAAAGWSDWPELSGFMHDVGRVTCARPDTTCFLAELEGAPIATGVVSIHEGVALLAGASTVPAARRKGAQAALLEARLRYAAERGCDLAMICALPGSPSQRNAERNGFRIAYTRLKWTR